METSAVGPTRAEDIVNEKANRRVAEVEAEFDDAYIGSAHMRPPDLGVDVDAVRMTIESEIAESLDEGE